MERQSRPVIVAVEMNSGAKKLGIFGFTKIWRVGPPRRGKFEPIITVAATVEIRSSTSTRRLLKMNRDESGINGGKKGCHLAQQLIGDIFRCWRQVMKNRVVFIEKPMIKCIVDNPTGALFDFANINEHAGFGIDSAGKYEVGDIISASAVAGSAFGPERNEVLGVRPAADVKTQRGRKFEAFANRQQHDARIVGRLCETASR